MLKFGLARSSLTIKRKSTPADMGCPGDKSAVDQIRENFEAPFDVTLRTSAFDDGHAAQVAVLSRGNCRRPMVEVISASHREKRSKAKHAIGQGDEEQGSSIPRAFSTS